jgi:hypothetical protein
MINYISGGGQEPALAWLRRDWTAYERVHLMVSRIYPVGLIIVFSLGLMLVPNETFGRSRGVGTMSPSGFHPSTRSTSDFHPSAMSAPIHRPSLNESSLQHRHQFGFGFPLLGSAGIYSYGTYSEPSNATIENPPVYIDQSNPPIEYMSQYSWPSKAEPTSSNSDRYVYVYRPGCNSETVKVPSEDGKEYSINIVRC